MSNRFDTRSEELTLENLPTPGAMKRWGSWVPTLDSKRIAYAYPLESREEAWAEAIRWLKLRAGLAMEVTINTGSGCVVQEGPSMVVETVAEARQVILREAIQELGSKGKSPEDRPFLRFRGKPTWENLAKCETYRSYDPDYPEDGMSCDYVLYEQGDLGGVGGGVWTYSVRISATAPPEVWDHPADQPCDTYTA